MTSFEKYLVEVGYEVVYPTSGYSTPSSLNNTYNRYVLGDRQFIVGLGEQGRSPYIIYPELTTETINNYGDRRFRTLGATEVQILMNKLTNEELESLFY